MKIIAGTGEVFMRYGIRSVTMDDIARELKVSKKTLYKYVKDKADLVYKVMGGFCEMEQDMITEIIKNSENAIDEVISISEFVGAKIADVHPSIHYDLEKYYPEAWEIFSKHKKGFVQKCLEANLERGIREGYYRDNMNIRILARLYVAKIDMVFDPVIFPPREFSFGDVHMELSRYHIRGIANEKGMAYLAKYVNKGTEKY